jgi:hypothetical protein
MTGFEKDFMTHLKSVSLETKVSVKIPRNQKEMDKIIEKIKHDTFCKPDHNVESDGMVALKLSRADVAGLIVAVQYHIDENEDGRVELKRIRTHLEKALKY